VRNVDDDIRIYDNETGDVIGNITEEQLQFLIDQLEEESSTDQDYFISRETLEMFGNVGADAELLDLLRGALGHQQSIEIRWAREG
jgi:hypothetical protein